MSKPLFTEKNIKRVSSKSELQGSMLPPLKVDKDSYMIKKPHHISRSDPVVTYLKLPKIIHTRPQDFMGLVQNLTGKASSVVSTSSSLFSSFAYGTRCESASGTIDDFEACATGCTRDFIEGQEKNETKENKAVPSSNPSNSSLVSLNFF